MKKIQILTSCLNEDKNIDELYKRLSAVFESERYYEWQLLIVDNGSSDSTWEVIKSLASNQSNVKGFRMSRIFSLDSAFTLLMKEFNGDLAVLMASDLQDTPETIPLLLREYEKGFLQVLVRIKNRSGISKTKKFLTKLFYRIANWSSDGLLPENVSDFRLIDQKVCKAMNELQERNRFIRGLAAWTGFPTSYVEIERPSRKNGQSSTNYSYLIRWSIRSIFANSIRPINFLSNAAIVTSFISFISLVISINLWIFYGVPFAGFGSLVSLLLVFFSFLIVLLAIIAEYVGLIYTEVKSRPHYIVWEETT